MTWLVWRQHRGEAIAVVLLAALLALMMLPSWQHMHAASETLAQYGCNSFPPPANPAPECQTARSAINSTTGTLSHIIPLFNVVPLLFGIFVGAPLVAREIEEGTWRLAWAQGVPRGRWLRYQLAGMAALTVVGAGLFALVMMWWLGPADYMGGRFSPNGFDFYGIVPVAWGILALALGVLAGVVIQRVIPAMAATLVAFTAIRFPVEWLRPHYLAPLKLWDVVPNNFIPLDSNNWIIGDPQVVAPGSHDIVSGDLLNQLQHSATGPPIQFYQYLQQHGYTWVITYQPADRFWIFQGIEAAICLALSVVAFLVARRLVLRHLT